MRQVGFPPLFVGEGHQKAVRIALRQHLRAVVRAPLVRLNHIDLAGQLAERGFHFFDLLGRHVLLEFEQHHVSQQLSLLGGRRRE